MSSLRRFLAQTAGTSGVEFALILPLLSALLFGAYEGGRMFWYYNIVAAASRDAARFAARLPMNCAGLVSGTDTTRVQRLARTGDVSGASPPLIPGWTSDSSVQVSVSCVSNASGTYSGRYKDVAQIPRVHVTANAPFQAIYGKLFPGLNITSIAVNNGQPWTE